ncbi:MAG: aspartate aminotransferase family protein [Candidatus Omnitrophica bacterium]|nr:aspartate aminotransferase family protein [Candidatus Omnitrophota bacterium]MCM8810878.1 aspartate aminotransferase family protein [Candidatus Omnitrophota bacterium]
MGKEFPLIPKKVKKVETKYRKIITDIPVPESIPVLEKLREYEPISMSGQPPIIWDKAIGINVYDKYGNMWLDFSSGVLVANAGHGNKFVIEEIKKQIEKPLLHNYCFPSEIRAELVEKIASLSPEPLKKVFLLTTGAEAIECAIKLARTYGKSKNKKVIISFEGAFHGRTLGAQMIGGIPNLKEWIVNPDPDIIQVPFPGDPRCKDKSFDLFLKKIKEKNINEKDVCAVISETYQGGNASLMPLDYAKQLREWCDKNEILLIFDEIQAGFGRTGTFWGFQHYGIIPDLFVLGKGISSSLPISAVVGRKEILDQYEPGTMTSTHTGNPLCCAAALGSINYIEKYRLWENAKKMGEIFEKKLSELKKYNCVGFVCGKGLVWGLHIVKNGTEPDPDTAFKIVEKSFEKGLLFFAPVGYKSATIKVNPPLIINEEAIIEGCDVIKEAIEEVLIG